MKKLMLLTLSLVLAGLVGSCFAETGATQEWGVGFETYYHVYKEPGVMRNKGMMYGLTGDYTYRDKFILRAEGRLAYGW